MKFKELALYFERLEATAKRLEMTGIIAELFRGVKEKKKIDRFVYLCQGQLQPAFRNVEFGVSQKLITKALAAAFELSEKSVENLFAEIGDLGEVGARVCTRQQAVLSVSEMYDELSRICSFSGAGSVAKKVEHISGILKKIGPQEAKYFLRIIIGKLRLGIGDPTVLDGMSLAFAGNKKLRPLLERAYNLCSDLGMVARILFSEGVKSLEDFKVIPGCPIRVALAARLPDAAEIIKKIGTCAVEPKYDGFRCQVHKTGDRISIYSRNLENTTEMFPDIREGTLRQIKEKNVILEGEAISYDPRTGQNLPFQTTVQRKRKHGITQMREKFPLKLFVFDMLYSGYDLTRKSYEERRRMMNKTIRKGDVLEISPSTIVETAEELNDIFQEAVDEGQEGIVAKRLDSGYQAGGRNYNWIKLKRSYSGKLNDTVDCAVLGYFRGKGARAVFGLGSLLVGVYDKKKDMLRTVAKLGSGLSEADLSRWKSMLDKIKLKSKPKTVDSLIEADVWVEPKFVVEVQADEITRSPVHTCGKTGTAEQGYALRFPRAVNFMRTDKGPEDATTVDEIKKIFSGQGRKK